MEQEPIKIQPEYEREDALDLEVTLSQSAKRCRPEKFIDMCGVDLRRTARKLLQVPHLGIRASRSLLGTARASSKFALPDREIGTRLWRRGEVRAPMLGLKRFTKTFAQMARQVTTPQYNSKRQAQSQLFATNG